MHDLHNRPHTAPPARLPSVAEDGNLPTGLSPPFTSRISRLDTIGDGSRDEESWGILLPVNDIFGPPLVLTRRAGLSQHPSIKKCDPVEETSHETVTEVIIGGYLIGRHSECDRIIDLPTISNRHCLLYCENKDNSLVAVIEDMSTNGTFLNGHLLKRNNRKELKSGDKISITDSNLCQFYYTNSRAARNFGDTYSITGYLGEGRFALTCSCMENVSGKLYAVKIVLPRAKSKQMQSEISALMALNHPKLLSLKDVFIDSTVIYLVLELAPEGDLFDFISSKRSLSESEARKVYLQMVQGLNYMHERNLIHCDIKPENILLVDKHLSIKIADFGLARIMDEDRLASSLYGTPAYIAPELLCDQKKRLYSPAVDVWSTGVVIYICLCGFPPFSKELYTKTFPYTLGEQIQGGLFIYPSPQWDHISDSALALIDGMLAVDREMRLTLNDTLSSAWVKAGVLEGVYTNDDLWSSCTSRRNKTIPIQAKTPDGSSMTFRRKRILEDQNLPLLMGTKSHPGQLELNNEIAAG